MTHYSPQLISITWIAISAQSTTSSDGYLRGKTVAIARNEGDLRISMQSQTLIRIKSRNGKGKRPTGLMNMYGRGTCGAEARGWVSPPSAVRARTAPDYWYDGYGGEWSDAYRRRRRHGIGSGFFGKRRVRVQRDCGISSSDTEWGLSLHRVFIEANYTSISNADFLISGMYLFCLFGDEKILVQVETSCKRTSWFFKNEQYHEENSSNIEEIVT